MPSKPKLDVSSPVSLQNGQLLRSRKEDYISTRKTEYWIRDHPVAASSDDSSDLAARKYPNARHIHYTPRPAPHDGIKPLPANRISHEMGRRTRRGVPATTGEFAMPLNAHLIKDELIGNSRPASFLRKELWRLGRKTIAPTFLAQAAGPEKRTALATSLAVTVVPCARAVCHSTPDAHRLAAQHDNSSLS